MFGVVAGAGIGPPGLAGFYQREHSRVCLLMIHRALNDSYACN